MSMEPEIDAQLKDVPLPAGLVARIQRSLGPGDDEIDRLLRAVEVPARLVDRLREIPADEVLAQELRDVAVPLVVVWQARRRSWSAVLRRGAQRAFDLALALLLFVSLGLGLTAVGGSYLTSIYPQAAPPDEPTFVIAQNLPLAIESAADDEALVELMTEAPVPPQQPIAADDVRLVSTTRPSFEPDEPVLPRWPQSSELDRWLAAMAARTDPLESVWLLRGPILGYPQHGDDELPALEPVSLPAPAGIEPPPIRGYDRMFALRHRVFPPIYPAAHPSLATVAIPLSTQTASWQEALRLARSGRRPAASRVRTEDFLAAMDYQFAPAPTGELAIRTAAGPSIFGPPSVGLLQVAAVAGDLPGVDAPPRHVVLAVDMSSTMARGERLAIVRQSIGRLLAHLRARDRLSLVVFQDEVLWRIERAGRADAEAIEELLANCSPVGGTDLAEGLQQAVALALGQTSPSETTQLVLITDSRVTMPPQGRAQVSELIDAAAAANVTMQVLDVAEHAERDETLAAWAERLGGEVHQPQSADEALWLLVEWLEGRSPVVAADARLTIRMNPRAVAAYRLIGHEPNAMAGLRPPALAAELRAEETATALLEIWFQPNDEDDLGQAELVWRDPVSGSEHRRTQRISRLQFAPTWKQAPISLQQGAIAAQTAELLRGSRTALRGLGLTPQGAGDFAQLRQAAVSVHPRLAAQPDFQQWLQLIRDLEALD